MSADKPPQRRKLVYVLLSMPFFGLLWPPLYSLDAPRLWHIPFFYWYQFAWVFLSALATGCAYLLDSRNDR
jgi:Protein of unknown function (DUF3311)